MWKGSWVISSSIRDPVQSPAFYISQFLHIHLPPPAISFLISTRFYSLPNWAVGVPKPSPSIFMRGTLLPNLYFGRRNYSLCYIALIIFWILIFIFRPFQLISAKLKVSLLAWNLALRSNTCSITSWLLFRSKLSFASSKWKILVKFWCLTFLVSKL